jgi:UDP-galactopyranose mutase
MLDLLVVGSGLTGATIARLAADAGYRVLVIERRAVVGGNIRDRRHESGMFYGLYGPHYFRTSSRRIWDFVNRFAEWRPFAAEVRTLIDGSYEHWPVTRDYIERECGADWSLPVVEHRPRNFEEACLAQMPREIYERFVEGYTRKQWGVDPCELDISLAGRFEVRDGTDRRLKQSTWQAVPVHGYADFAEALLHDGDIKVECRAEPLSCREIHAQLTVWTGAIDEYFGFDLGRMRYRAQRRDLMWFCPETLPTVQTNVPSLQVPAVRAIAWNYLNPGYERGWQLVTSEAPYTPSDPDAFEYPFPAAADRALCAKYRTRANALDGIIFAGRLGDFRYYDMDQAIGHAMTVFRAAVAPALR